MHLLRSRVDITVIALWLGHEDTVTTHQYVEADLAMKPSGSVYGNPLAGTVSRPSANLHHPRGRRLFRPTRPPRVDDTRRESLELLEQGPRPRVSPGTGANLVESLARG